jgi:O-antigen/teichoic acid export membrane protein
MDEVAATMTSLMRPPEGRARPRLLARLPGRSVIDNVGARVVAMVSVALVTVMVARTGGAGDVGLLALMRVLPGLAGVLAACGLPGAMGYFVAGPDRSDPRLWPTVSAVMTVGALGGSALWLALTPVIHDHLMPTTSLAVVAAAGATVATQLPVAVAKAGLQALEDLRGSNAATAAEEAAFVPAFALAWAMGLRSGWLLVVALLIADVAVAAAAWVRIARRVRACGQPVVGRADRALASRIVRFGLRSQVGGVVGLLNLRFDFLVLGAMAGPAPVGIYAVASKYAELLRLPALAVTWVSYPRVARGGAASYAASARRLVPLLLVFGAVVGAALALAAFPLFPLVYGQEFRAAAWPAAWIALGLIAEPAAGAGAAFLLGTGRPGLNSAVMGAGLLVTVALDLVLIPQHGALGAAWASAGAYLVTDILLIWSMARLAQRTQPALGRP